MGQQMFVDEFVLKNGLPQGSVKGLIICMIFMNDLNDVLEIMILTISDTYYP